MPNGNAGRTKALIVCVGIALGFLLAPRESTAAGDCGHQACNLDTGVCTSVKWDIDCYGGDPCTDGECKPVDPEG